MRAIVAGVQGAALIFAGWQDSAYGYMLVGAGLGGLIKNIKGGKKSKNGGENK